MFEALEPAMNLTERAERQLEELIVAQSLRSGERLPPQGQLARSLGVSRTVIREAVRFLIAKGLLIAKRGSGVYVGSASAQLSGEVTPNRNFQALSRETGTQYTHKEEKAPSQEAGGERIRVARLLPEQRRRKIIDLLNESESITVFDLADKFGVSPMTARADLDSLAAEGALVRSHGGALRSDDLRTDYPLRVKQTLHHAEKVRIAAAAANLIRDGDAIAFDSGTTTCEVARQIKHLHIQSLTVVTNALNIANELSGLSWVSLILTGGMLRHKSGSLTGPHAHQTLQDLHIDHLFLGADALDVEAGLTTPDILGAEIALRMIELAREVTVVVDASKFGRHSLTLSGKIEDVDRIITDDHVSSSQVALLQQRGVEVVIV
jgi:DeoR family transcriptional regulator, aga operon transcriptional repressor